MSSRLILLLSVPLTLAIAADGGGFRVGAGDGATLIFDPDAKQADGPIKQSPQPYEPWVATAQAGDYIVRKYADGHTERWEITAIDDDHVCVQADWTIGERTTVTHKRYERAEKGEAAVSVLDMRPGKGGVTTIAGTKVRYRTESGFAVTATAGSGRSLAKLSHVKLSRLQRAIAAEVPFGGVIRMAQAPDDGLPTMMPMPVPKLVRHYNRNEQHELVFEVVAFGSPSRIAARADDAPGER